jgi:hypothetical protein
VSWNYPCFADAPRETLSHAWKTSQLCRENKVALSSQLFRNEKSPERLLSESLIRLQAEFWSLCHAQIRLLTETSTQIRVPVMPEALPSPNREQSRK